jgi:hypothetical protein
VDQAGRGRGFSCYNIREFPIYINASLLLAPAVWNPKSVLSSLLRGFGGAIVRARIIHLWDCGFDPHIGLKILMWKELVNTLPNVWFPTTGNVDRVGWDYPLNWPSTIAVHRDQTWVIRWLPECPYSEPLTRSGWAASLAIQLSSQLQVSMISS